MKPIVILSISILFLLFSTTQSQFRQPSDNPPRDIRVNLKSPVLTTEVKKGGTQPQAQTAFSHGDPTAEEQMILEYINRARANPTEEGLRLAETKDADVLSNYRYWNIDVNKLKTQFATYPARPPIAFHAKLNVAARAHSEDMKAKNFQAHNGSDGSDPGSRMRKAGYTGLMGWAENIAAYSRNPWHGHCGLNVDWGTQNQIDLGHRHNIMNFAASDAIYNEIGIGAIAGLGGNNVGPLIITQDFTTSSVDYVVGVVYKDKNNNGFYDIGEGLAGVEVTPSKGSYKAITSTSGGYAFPITGTGSVTITAAGPGLSSTQTKTVTLTGENVKVDFGQESAPGVTLVFPTDGEIISQDSIRFLWRKSGTSVKTYHIQVAKDVDFKELVVNDSTVKDTSFVLISLDNFTTYYWRSSAKHTTLGWGPFNAPVSFQTALLPGNLALLLPADKELLWKDTVVFSWQKPKPIATSYTLEISTDKTFKLNVDMFLVDDTVFVWTDARAFFEDGKTYYWRAMATNDAGDGQLSAVREFSFSFAGVENDLFPISTASAFSGNELTVQLLSKSIQTVSLELVSLRGNIIRRLFQGEIGVGSEVKKFSFDGECFAREPIFLVVRSGKKFLVEKLMP